MEFFIDDRQERQVYLAETPFHPACRLTFRPMSATAREKAISRIDAAEEKVAEATRLVAPRIESWSLPGEASPENFKRLEPNLLNRIRNVVLYLEPPDDDPGGEDAEDGDQLETEQLGN